MYVNQGFHFVFKQQMNEESQQMAGVQGAAQVPWWVRAKPGGGDQGGIAPP